jgi:6-pyruvoyltetrahydropterin/6-carboxytetrahydropterin synthase
MRVTATRRIQFCAGHRVVGHESKCANLHGHNYVALLTAEAEDAALDSIGRVIDFSALKERIGGWVERMWDHGFLLYSEDPARDYFEALAKADEQKLFVMPDNPTAENIGLFLLKRVAPAVLEGTGVSLVRVEVWETENCRAEVEL